MSTVACDVAIIGGGLVGASLARALSPLGLSIALLESTPPRAASHASYDDRTLALSFSSCRILEALGLWPGLQANATAIREIHVSAQDGPGLVVMRPSELGLEVFGQVVEARVLGAAVMDSLAQRENIDFICPAKVEAIEMEAEFVRVSYTAEAGVQQLTARLLVGADGAESLVRDAVGIEAERYDYGQTAVICNVTPALAHNGRAYERFTASGPFALLPHVDGRCGLVWSAFTAEAEELMDMDEESFLQRARVKFGNSLGEWKRLGKRSSYPLRLVRALQDIHPRTIILGNAAHAIHPIGAQGFNLGLRDVAVLADVLASRLQQDAQADIGEPALLERYSAWRAPDQQGTIAWSDGLARLYANPTGVAAAARTLGLLAHALFPPLRRQLAIRAMGYRGRVPRLAMGEPLVVQR